MDYQKIYNNLILRAQKENRIKYKEIYYEEHHIIPRCLNGTHEEDNKVLLTAKEHFLCHKILCEIYDNPKLKYAYWAMCNQTFGDVERNYRISAKTYQEARENFIIAFSKFAKSRIGEKNSFFGKKHSEKTKKNWSIKRKNHFMGEENAFFGKKHSDKTKEQIRNSRKDRNILPWNINKKLEKTYICEKCQRNFSKQGLTQHQKTNSRCKET